MSSSTAFPSDSLVVLAAVGEVEQHAGLVQRTAVRIARAHPSSVLHLVHVVEVIAGAEPAIRDEGWSYPGASELRARSQALLDQYVLATQELLGRPVTPHLDYGPAGLRIIALAEKLRSDVVVIGPLDKSRWQRFVFGSVAEEILRKAPCSVVLAREKHSETDAERR